MRWWNEAARLGDRHACWFVGRLTPRGGTTPAERARGWELIELRRRARLPAGVRIPRRGRGPGAPLPPRGPPRGARVAAPPPRGGSWRLRRRPLPREVPPDARGPGAVAEEAVYWLHEASRRDAAAARMLAPATSRAGLGVPRATRRRRRGSPSPPRRATRRPPTSSPRRFLDGQRRAARPGGGDPPRGAGRGRGVRQGRPASRARSTRTASASPATTRGPRPGSDGARSWATRTRCTASRTSCSTGGASSRTPARAVAWLEKAVEDGRDRRRATSSRSCCSAARASTPTRRGREATFLRRRPTSRTSPRSSRPSRRRRSAIRPAATRPRDLRDRIEELVADPESLPAASALELGLLYLERGRGPLRGPGPRHASSSASPPAREARWPPPASPTRCRLAGDDDGEMEWLETAARSGPAGSPAAPRVPPRRDRPRDLGRRRASSGSSRAPPTAATSAPASSSSTSSEAPGSRPTPAGRARRRPQALRGGGRVQGRGDLRVLTRCGRRDAARRARRSSAPRRFAVSPSGVRLLVA